MTLYSLGYPDLNEADDKFIYAYRKEHDVPYRDVVSYHFTLVFGINKIDKDTYIEHVRRIARRQKQISFVCRYAMLANDDSNSNYYVFLVPDEGYSQVSLLHDHLYTGPLKPFHLMDIPYIPHVGIATIPDAQKVKGLCDSLNAKGINISGILKHITVCELKENRIIDLERFEFSN